jgi:SHAQKYF class myb-like DNA-binding protein
LCH